MSEVIINNVKFKNVPDKRYGTKIGDLLTQSNVGMSQTVADYIQSDDFYALVNGVDIDWNSIEVEDGLVLNTTADLINWIVSIINKIPLVKIISVVFSTEKSFPTSEEIQQLLDMSVQDFARYGSKYQYYFYLKKEQKYYFIPAAYNKDNTNVISIRGIDDIAVLSFNESYANGALSFSEKQAPDLSNYYTKEEVNTLLDGKIDLTLKGAKNGVASLDSTGKVPASQLPSYVDDVLEGYLDDSHLVESFSELNSYNAGEIVLYLGTIYRFKVNHAPGIFTPDEMQKIDQFPAEGETGKIYSDIITGKTYRWSGSTYVPIKGDVVIGTTQGTAFDGAAGAALQTQVSGISTQVAGKVDKETGKGLSSNDYTNEEKQKVADALVPADIAEKANASDVYTKEETYSKTEVNNLITTPNQQYVSVTATTQTTAVTDVLPATGAADTTYRVGCWDGTQYNDSVFSEYAWNGSAYIKLSTKAQVGEVYDISANHADTKYSDLAAALGTDGANIPSNLRKGGMSVKFVQSSDNNYVQARLMADSFTTDVTKWQSVDDEPTAGSDNLVKSGGVAFATQKSIYDYQIAGVITASGLRPANVDGRCAIIPIQNGDTIVATAPAAYSYFAIIKQLPDFSQTNPSIPYATGESRRYFEDGTQTINVSAQDAKYLIVELWRQVTGEAIQNTAPLQLIINGYDYAITKTQESLVLNNTLKSGCFVPKYGQYVNITDITITIPAGSRIIYRYKQYYTNDAAIVLNRQSGAQNEFVCFDTEDNTYKILSYRELNLKSNLLVCFYVRYTNECSLPHMTYKINGNYDFRALDNPVENSNNGLVTSGSIYNYVRVNSDTERAVIGNRKKYSSNNSTTTVFLDSVRLQKTHLYRLTLNAVTAFTPNENYTIKVMSANSDASLLTIAQLNGVQISNNVFYFYWEQDSALTYRIGQFGTQALNTICISLSDVTDEMSGSVFPDLWENGVYIDNTGSLVKDAQWCVSEKIRCSLGDIIHWRSGLSTTSYQISLVLFDVNDTLISYISVGAGTGGQWQRVLQIDNANVAYCRASFYISGTDGFISIYNNNNPDDFKYIKFNQALLFSINQVANTKDITKDIVYLNKHKESTLMATLLHKGNDNIKVNDKLSLLHCTDLHGDSGNLARIVEYRNNYLTYLDDTIHTGDTVAGTINDSNPFVAVNGANTILNVAGNHEAWLSYSDTDYLATEKQVYDKIFAPSIADWNVVQPENAASDGKCYYYKDYRNFRLIVLDNVHWHTGGNQHIIDDASVQKAWFESVLADAALNEKIVVCAMHYPPIHIVPSANVKGFNDYGVTENTDIGDGWYANDEIFDCVDDFISGNGKFAGWLIGHTHSDYIGYVKGHANQPIVILRNCGLNSASATNKNIFGTSAQDCFNIVTFDWIDASNHLIKIVRIGNDADMYGRSKKSISFNIVNGDVLEVE